MRVLVGDIGGTKTELALAQVSARAVQLEGQRRYASAQAASLGSILRAYLRELGELAHGHDLAALAVAGPVQGNRCKTTNLPWELVAEQLADEIGVPAVVLLNDLEAVAWAIPGLGAAELRTLHQPVAGPDPGPVAGPDPGQGGIGNACVIAAGTGLGVAGLCWDRARQRHIPFATEAGHAEFAPVDEREFALTRALRARHGRASWERVASGQGIVNLYEFLVDWRGAPRPSWLDEREPAAMIAHAAERGRDPLAVETMAWFAGLLARFVGDLALSHMAVGGVYLTGGVLTHNLRLLDDPAFLAGVFAKGRMGEVVQRAPIHVITAADVALRGAGLFAAASSADADRA